MSQKLKKNSNKSEFQEVVDSILLPTETSIIVTLIDGSDNNTKNEVKSTYLAGWSIPEEIIRLLAYELWQQNFSQDPDVNWHEAVRQIEQGLRI